MKIWLLLMVCMILITSITTAASSFLSSPAASLLINTTALSSMPKTTVDLDKILEIALIQKASLEQSGLWPPLMFIEGRQFKFNYTQKVNGLVSPVHSKDRDLGSYASVYKKTDIKSAGTEERTSALKGNYKSEESLGILSTKGGALGWLIVPPLLAVLDEYGLLNDEIATNQSQIFSDKNIEYSGKGINNLECYWNRNPVDKTLTTGEQQYLSTDFLYNKKLTKESKSFVTQHNALITNSIVYLDDIGLRTIADLNYSLNSQSSGIADINYGKVKFRQPIILKTKPGSMYTVEIEGQERYIGNYNISKNIRISSISGSEYTDENWIPCCFEGWDTMPLIYQRKFGRDAKGVFDCRCHLGYAYGIDALIPLNAQFNNTAI